MATLGLEDYIEPLRIYLARYSEMLDFFKSATIAVFVILHSLMACHYSKLERLLQPLMETLLILSNLRRKSPHQRSNLVAFVKHFPRNSHIAFIKLYMAMIRSMSKKYRLKLPDVLTNRKTGSPENDALAFLQIKHVCKLGVVQIQKVIRIKLMLKVALQYW